VRQALAIGMVYQHFTLGVRGWVSVEENLLLRAGVCLPWKIQWQGRFPALEGVHAAHAVFRLPPTRTVSGPGRRGKAEAGILKQLYLKAAFFFSHSSMRPNLPDGRPAKGKAYERRGGLNARI